MPIAYNYDCHTYRILKYVSQSYNILYVMHNKL